MPEERLKPGLRAALRMHEIGAKSPYRLYFASKGNSGASFGFMQGDLAAGQPVAVSTFQKVMKREGISDNQTAIWLKALSVHLVANPLSKADTDRVNAALASQKDLVDAMDQSIFLSVCKDIDKCFGAADKAGREIDDRAAMMMTLWVNMTGKPTKILTWIAGGNPHLTVPVPAPGDVITGTATERYLRATDYYSSNPGNFPHLLESVEAGLNALAGILQGAPAAALASPPYTVPAGDHFLYEQKTGRMFVSEDGGYDQIGTGYSGSLAEGGVNDPDQQCVKNIGPIPRGRYTIGKPVTGPSPFSLPLTPDPGNHMCGRSAFLIHGDSIAHPGTASQGCIILKKSDRQKIADSGITTLVVVASASA